MIAWEPIGNDDFIPIIYCDCCGQQCNIYRQNDYISCDEIDGKHYCSECLTREMYNEMV